MFYFSRGETEDQRGKALAQGCTELTVSRSLGRSREVSGLQATAMPAALHAMRAARGTKAVSSRLLPAARTSRVSPLLPTVLSIRDRSYSPVFEDLDSV